MKLNQLLIILFIGISSSLTAQIYSDINITLVPSNTVTPSPGVSFGYNLNNLLGVGAFAQSQLGQNYQRNSYNLNKENGVYYGVEVKGSTRSNNNAGWIYKGRIGFGNYKYDSYYEGAQHRVNSFYEVFLGKNINRRFSFGLGWRQSSESSDLYQWVSPSTSTSKAIGVFDRTEIDVYNDFFLRMAYTIGKPANASVQETKAMSVLNKLYLDFFIGKNLQSTSNNYSNNPLDQIEMGIGLKINDDIGIGIGAFMSTDINTFIEEDLIMIDVNKIAYTDERFYNYGSQGSIGFGLQLRATPGKWHYKVEVGNISKIASNNNQYYSEAYLIDVAYYYNPVNVKTDGFNPYVNLHVGRTFWDAITLSAGYTYAPNIDYTYALYEGADEFSSRLRYHAPQIKLGFTLD